jgi:Ca2+-binding RTX toxin-like protein
VINGGDGRNFLLGTNGPDIINGGNGDDVIVGRGGADTLNGGNGNNSYSPWPSLADPALNNLTDTLTTTVSGGSGLDVIYLRGNRDEFSGVSNCKRTGNCTIKPTNEAIKISLLVNSGFEVIVFKNARIDLP